MLKIMRHQYFNQNFKNQLWQVIADIESDSQIELVVIVRNRAADYQDVALFCGLCGAWLTHSYLMFIPTLFGDLTIYLGPILGFMMSWSLGKLPIVQRLCISQKRVQKNVEIMARALFQKGGLQHTQAKIGVLIYCSLLEKKVFILPDRGAELAVPLGEWQALQHTLQTTFKAPQPHQALLIQLSQMSAIFKQYLPSTANNINELPDNLDITL